MIAALAGCGFLGNKSNDKLVNNSIEVDETVEEASQRKNPIFVERNTIGKKNFPLSDTGKIMLKNILANEKLVELYDLDELEGINKLTKDLCNQIFDKYKTENQGTAISGEQCSWNLNDDKTYTDVNPITITISEFNNDYLLLLIDEEGLGAPNLFTFLYDMKAGKISSFHRPSLGETIAYYDNHVLYFVNVAGYLELAYDLKEKMPVLIENN